MNNDNKPTAVEWQAIELMRINFEYATSKITPAEFKEQIKQTLEKAKEMFEEQMIEFGARCIKANNEIQGGNK